jgi:hypothetical protein
LITWLDSSHNANIDPCDMWEGPCACGSTHVPGEFELNNEDLYRYGKFVIQGPGRDDK